MNEQITNVHYEVEYHDDYEGWTRYGERYGSPQDAIYYWPSHYETGDLRIFQVVTTESEVPFPHVVEFEGDHIYLADEEVSA